MRDGMAVQQWGHWLRQLMAKLLLLSLFLRGGAATPLQGETYSRDTLEEVADIPVEDVTRLCVVPLNDNTRLKVRHTDAEGGRQEVLVKKKALPADTLIVLEIEVEAGDADKATLSVRMNGTQLRPRPGLRSSDDAPRPTSPAPQWPRTALLLKGTARITKCTTASEEGVVLGNEKLRMMTVTEGHGGEMIEGREEETERQGGEEVLSSNAYTTPLPSSATNVSIGTEDPESGKEEPWWNFLLVLGKVGEVPVLLLLLACLLVGVLVGSILVCLCSNVCQKRRVQYVPVSTRRTHSGHLAGDIVRDPKFWDTLSSRQRSSGIGSAYSTLNTDNGSQMGTTNSRDTGTRLAGSANNSIDRSTKGPTQIGVNNLGRGPTGSPSSSINRSRNNSSANVLNIPHGSGMTRSSSNRSTGSSDNRDVNRSPMLTQDSRVARTSSNRSTSSSINRNTNRSPNIPYTNKLGIFVGHQDAPTIQKPVNRLHDSDEDSDDSSYDKPYISPPIVAENYSVPHVSSAQPVLVELRTTTSSSNDPTSRQVPVYQFGTFKK